MTAAQASAVDQAVAALRSELLSARVSVALSFDLFAGNAKSTAQAALEACAKRIDSLDGPCRARLELNDAAYPFSRFAADAEETHQTLASITGDVSSWSLSGVLRGAAAATAADVKAGVEVGAPIGLGLVMAALLVVAALQLLPLFRAVRA